MRRSLRPRVYPPCQGVSGGAWRCQVHHPNSLWLGHKVFVGPFARSFPNVQVFVAPNQWSFPQTSRSVGSISGRRTQVLPEDSADAPCLEFDYAVLDINLGRGRSGSGILPQALTHTLVTDSVLSVPEDPPAIVQLEPYPLLFHARDDVRDRRGQPGKPPRDGSASVCLYCDRVRWK